MYELARPAIYSYSIQRGTPHVNLRQKRASLFNSQILVVALIGIFGGLKPKMCVHFSRDWRSGSPQSIAKMLHFFRSSFKMKTEVHHYLGECTGCVCRSNTTKRLLQYH